MIKNKILNDGELLTVKEAGQLLRCGPDGVRYLHRKGLLEAIRTKSGIRLFNESDVINLAKERKRKLSSNRLAQKAAQTQQEKDKKAWQRAIQNS